MLDLNRATVWSCRKNRGQAKGMKQETRDIRGCRFKQRGRQFSFLLLRLRMCGGVCPSARTHPYLWAEVTRLLITSARGTAHFYINRISLTSGTLLYISYLSYLDKLNKMLNWTKFCCFNGILICAGFSLHCIFFQWEFVSKGFETVFFLSDFIALTLTSLSHISMLYWRLVINVPRFKKFLWRNASRLCFSQCFRPLNFATFSLWQCSFRLQETLFIKMLLDLDCYL